MDASTTIRFAVAHALIAGFLLVSAAGAQTPAVTPPPTQRQVTPVQVDSAAAPKPDARSEEILRAMSKHYRQYDNLSASVNTVFRVSRSGVPAQEMSGGASVAFARPMKLAVDGETASGGYRLVHDGKRLTTFIPRTGRYVEQPSPATFEDLFMQTSAAVAKSGSPSSGLEHMMLLGLLADDPYNTLVNSRVGVEYVGERTIDGLKLHYLRFVENEGHVDVWIEAGETPWVRRFAPDVSGHLKSLPKELTVEMIVRFDHWSGEAIAESTFDASLPQDAQQAKDFGEAMLATPQ